MRDNPILEAYPQLDIQQAYGAHSSGRTVCRFDCDERGLLGIGWFSECEESYGLLELHLIGTDPADFHGGDRLAFVMMKGGLGQDRIYVRCPMCHRPFVKIAWKGDWACRSCHQLHYRRQLVPRKFLDIERKLELDGMLGSGRPKGMHQPRYLGLLAEQEALHKKLPKDVPSMLSREQRYRVRSVWFATEAKKADPEFFWRAYFEKESYQGAM